MASGSPQECCVRGVIHEGQPVGSFQEVGGIRSYVTHPKEQSDYALIYIPDGMGCDLVNAQLLADDFARAGYHVVIPAIFEWDPVPASVLTQGAETFDLENWIARHGRTKVQDICDAALRGVKSEFGVKKIGAVGYCFGGGYVVRFLSSNSGVEAGFIAHPSLVDVSAVEGIEKPLSIACAEIDEIMTAELRHKTEEILSKKSPLPYQLCLYSNVEHGFAVRTDLNVRACRFAKEGAFFQAVRWFDEWLKKDE